MGGSVYWNEETNTVDIFNTENTNMESLIRLLDVATRITEIAKSCERSFAGAIATNNNVTYNTWYEVFKYDKQFFLDYKQAYLDCANGVIQYSPIETNKEVANKVLKMMSDTESVINMTADLFVTYDDYKGNKMSGLTNDIYVMSAEVRAMILNYINK